MNIPRFDECFGCGQPAQRGDALCPACRTHEDAQRKAREAYDKEVRERVQTLLQQIDRLLEGVK